MASAYFADGVQGWSAVLEDSTPLVEPLTHLPMAIEHQGPAAAASSPASRAGLWWFGAPREFVDLGPELYGARLCFTVSQHNVPSPPAMPLGDPPKGHKTLPDVVLSSTCGARLGLFGIIKPGRAPPTEYCVSIHESQGWQLATQPTYFSAPRTPSEGGENENRGSSRWVYTRQSSKEELAGVLWHLQDVLLRGRFYAAQHRSRLSQVCAPYG